MGGSDGSDACGSPSEADEEGPSRKGTVLPLLLFSRIILALWGRLPPLPCLQRALEPLGAGTHLLIGAYAAQDGLAEGTVALHVGDDRRRGMVPLLEIPGAIRHIGSLAAVELVEHAAEGIDIHARRLADLLGVGDIRCQHLGWRIGRGAKAHKPGLGREGSHLGCHRGGASEIDQHEIEREGGYLLL